MKFGDIKKYNIEFIIKANPEDEFSHLLLVNGLYVKDGGTPIDYILNKIISPIKDKLSKKYPSIKPADIKNKLKIYLNMRFIKNLKFNSQTKEKITNNIKDFDQYFEFIDWNKVIKKILTDKEIIGLITDYFELKQKAKEQAELRKLGKTRKKIKSDKYYPANNEKEILFICEGESALGGTIPILGKTNYGYYVLKGKPLNVLNISNKKFTSNKELSELYQIIQNEDYKKIAIMSDQDLDGMHINGLMLVFFYKYFPNLLKEKRIFRFNTPVAASIKNKKLIKWVYNFNEINNLTGNIKYFKGLGSWTKELLEQVINKDGIDKMLKVFEYNENDEDFIKIWFDDKLSDKRKEIILNHNFNIVKI